jgi:hypothetical protein
MLLYFHLQGGLQWVKFNAATNNYNLTIDHVDFSISDYSFSIAVSSGLFSQGMADWITCLYDYHKCKLLLYNCYLT